MRQYQKNLQALVAAALVYIRPIERISPWRWAELNVELSPRTTAKPGKYDSSWMCYVREWHDAFADPHISELVICAGAQMSKTETLLNMVRYCVGVDPGPLLWVMPAQDIARTFSETRLQPSLEDCPPCAEQIPSNADKFKLMEMNLNNMNISLAGANSAAQLASKPIRYLFLDEVDKFPESTSKEAGAVELAKVRTTSFYNRKIVCTSTPTLEEGAVWQAYLKGDQRKFFVLCPFCKSEILLELAQLRFGWCRNEDGEWDFAQVAAETTYACQECEDEPPMSFHRRMIATGTWKPTNPAAPKDVRSYHISTLYSPFKSWGQIAVEFLQSKGDYSAFQNFTNSVLAMPWKQDAEEVEEDEIQALTAPYSMMWERDDVWDEVVMVTIGADVGDAYIVYTVRGWNSSGDSWLLTYGKATGFEEMDEVSARWRPEMGMMDSGHRSKEVYEFCSASKGIWHPSKGASTQVVGLVRKAKVRWTPANSYKERFISLYNFWPDAFKSQLYLYAMKGKTKEGWNLPQDLRPDYVRQVTNEKVVTKRDTRGRPKAVWIQGRENHYGDCEVLQLVMFHLIARKLKTIKSKEDGTRRKNDPHVERRSASRRKAKRRKLRKL